MAAALMSSNAMDEANTKNRRGMLAVEYKGDSKGWTLLKYVAVHKKCYADQSNLNISHNFPDFTEREKVTALLDGIMSRSPTSCAQTCCLERLRWTLLTTMPILTMSSSGATPSSYPSTEMP